MLSSGIPTEKRHLPLFLASGLFCLLLGSYAGLHRLGLPLPGAWAGFHGPLMVCGFLGTLIGLERAVHLGSRWALLVPLSAFLGALSLLAGHAAWALGLWLWLFSAIMHLGVFLKGHFPLKLPEDLLSVCGLLCWLISLFFWLEGHPLREISVALLFFPLLTILAERWPGATAKLKMGGGITLGCGLGLSALLLFLLPNPDLPLRLSGVCLMGAGLFLSWQERPLKTTLSAGQKREQGWELYLERVMVMSYGWLSLSGLLFLLLGEQGLREPFYDLLIHGLSLGFILGVIFSHFYKVLKALLGADLPFYQSYYLPWGLLQAGLLLRAYGKVGEHPQLWQIGGSLNVLALLLFLGLVARALQRGLAT
ncbi:MAG: hypothetical protein AB7I41_08940 [Candidatus Sericytochromatia bacterium]